jgi:hypothetical protein
MIELAEKNRYHMVPATQSVMPHPAFCVQDYLDIQESVSYTLSFKKKVLIKERDEY